MKSKGKKMKKSPHKWDGRRKGERFTGKINKEFHNPYHFVPVRKPVFEKDGLKWLDISEGQGDTRRARLHEGLKKEGLSHDRYHPGRYHGRITCFLETKTPIFIGARRIRDGSKESPAAVAPFELEESPAIPSSTLRGMISSVLEAASNSSLRVLEDKILSMRKPPNEALSALGMIVKKNGAPAKLLPLAAPILETKPEEVSCRKEGNNTKFGKPDKNALFEMEQKFFKAFKNIHLPIKICTDLKELKGSKLVSYSATNQQFYYMNIKPVFIDQEIKREQVPGSNLRTKDIHFEKDFKKGKCKVRTLLLYQKGFNNEIIKIKAEDFKEDRHKGWTKGIMRIFDFKPSKHNYFIPFDGNNENFLLDIDENILERFRNLASERAQAVTEEGPPLPHMPQHTGKGKDFDLVDGDIVVFDVNEEGMVSEISYSAIWRKDCGTVHDFFKRIDQELLPFSPERKKVSPAELIFGFVEDMSEKPKERPESALAYAGRVRFSHGLLEKPDPEGDPYMDEVTLKILASPKPPCPCMYFYDTENGNRFIAKDMLTNQGDGKSGKYLPKGRKFYLHHNLEKEEEFGRKYNGQSLPPWETHPNLAKPNNKESRLKQKAAVRPVRKGLTFKFHVDFENLDETELALLLYSLSPGEGFWHKIGMGKPIGLGSVEIKVDSVELIDREKRYTKEDPFGPGTTRYNLEHKITENVFKIIKDDKNFENILKALKQIGNPKNVTQRVQTPLTISQSGENEEKETFRWFDYNNKNYKKQQLPTLPVEHGPLPLLKRNEKPKKKGR